MKVSQFQSAYARQTVDKDGNVVMRSRVDDLMPDVVTQLQAYETQHAAIMATQLRRDVQDAKVVDLKLATRTTIETLRGQLKEAALKGNGDREGEVRARAKRVLDLGANPSSGDLARATVDRLARLESTILLAADVAALPTLEADDIRRVVDNSLLTEDPDRLERILPLAEQRLAHLSAQAPNDGKLVATAAHVRTAAATWRAGHPTAAEQLATIERERVFLAAEIDGMVNAAIDGILGRRQDEPPPAHTPDRPVVNAPGGVSMGRRFS